MVARKLLLLVLTLMGLALALPARADFYIVVHASNPQRALTQKEAVDLFMGRSRAFGNGDFALIFDLPRDNPRRAAFYQALTGMSVAQVNSYWSRLMFSGQSVPPQALPDETAMAGILRRNPSALGWLSKEPTDAGLRTVLVIKDPSKMKAATPQVRGASSLQLRFMLMVFASAALIAVIAATIAYQLGQARALASSRSSVEALATAVEKTLAIGAFANDAVLLQEVAGGLARNELVDVVEVVAADGRALAKALRSGATERERSTLLTRPLSSPFDANERLGQLRIRLNDAKVQADADREAYTLAAAMAGQAALLALILYLLAARLVSQPIVQLASAMRRMTPGSGERLDTPASHAGDEIGVLIAGANALLEANERAFQTERHLRAEVEAMEAQYRQIFDSSSAGIFVLNEGGRLINGNPTVSRVVGLSMAELRTLSEDDFIARVFNRPEQVRQMIDEATARGETISADLELVQQGEERRWVHCLISVQPVDDERTVEGVIYDITERKTDENAVRYRAEHDGLTQLKNRAAGQATLERFVADAHGRGASLCVACIDLDGFKQINDSHGHQSGDEVLVACAERMRAAVRRSSDLVARLGGDEFLVALRDVGPGDAVLLQVMQDLLTGLSQPIRLSTGEEVSVGVSIGVACQPTHAAEATQLVRAADEALYHVKRNGKQAFALALPE